jgi:hypothetical protein
MNDSSAARSGAVQAAAPINQTIEHRDRVQSKSLVIIKVNTGISLYGSAVLKTQTLLVHLVFQSDSQRHKSKTMYCCIRV